MRDVFVIADNIVSPLGRTTEENFRALAQDRTAIRLHETYYASLFDSQPTFENLALDSAAPSLRASGLDPADPRLVFILSSTKGNTGLLEHGVTDPDRISLAVSAQNVATALGLVNPPIVVSHACISGLQAMITASRLLKSGVYDHALICGADLITNFILSGFQSFQAVSPEPCRPFDADRKGVTLGEAAASAVLTTARSNSPIPDGSIRLMGGAVSNDANHISGPSRTGEELALAIRRALTQAGNPDIDFISAHGTATVYNDDMEAKAIHLTGLKEVPVGSLKGFFGHTLGAAGLLEAIVSMQSLRENLILPTRGYGRPGTVLPVNVLSKPLEKPIRHCLKTASGFGGCNAAVILEKTKTPI